MFTASTAVNFHFISFVINLLSWTFLGIGMGFFLHKGVRIRQNGSVSIGGIASLIGGSFSAMTHGVFPSVGIDFFNLFIAFLFSLVALYTFSPNTRVSIANVWIELLERSKGFVKTISEGQKLKFPYFNSYFWRNITSDPNS